MKGCKTRVQVVQFKGHLFCVTENCFKSIFSHSMKCDHRWSHAHRQMCCIIFEGIYVRKTNSYLDRVKRIWYLSPMRAVKVQTSLRIRAVSPEPSLLAHTSSESRGTFRQKARSLAPLNGWACAVNICHDGMLEDTNSLDGAHLIFTSHVF